MQWKSRKFESIKHKSIKTYDILIKRYAIQIAVTGDRGLDNGQNAWQWSKNDIMKIWLIKA